MLRVMLRVVIVYVSNVALFIECAIRMKTPILLWPKAWQQVKRSHEQEIAKQLTGMVMRGEILRRMVDGEFRYYPIEEGSDMDIEQMTEDDFVTNLVGDTNSHTDVSSHGFCDAHGDYWLTWLPNGVDEDVLYRARRERDDFTIDVKTS